MSKNKKRMAGQKLDERFGKGFTDRVKGDGMQEPTDQGYSKRELLAEFRARPDGVKIDEGKGNLVGKYQALVNSGSRFNNQAEDYLKSHGVIFKQPKDVADNSNDFDDSSSNTAPSNAAPSNAAPISIGTYSPSYESSPVQTITSSPGSGGGMNVNNDIYSSIIGNDNNLSNYQDNSISGPDLADIDLGDDGYDYMQAMNINQDDDIYTDIVGNSNIVSNFQDNSIGNSSYSGDGLYAQRNPMDFKKDFINNLFS